MTGNWGAPVAGCILWRAARRRWLCSEAQGFFGEELAMMAHRAVLLGWV
jgi:hypothetical protein